MNYFARRYRLFAAIPVYGALYVIGLAAAFLLRFEAKLSAETTQVLLTALPYVLVAKLCIFIWGGEWRRYHRYTTLSDMAYITGIRTVESLVVLGGAGLGLIGGVIPRSVILIDWMLVLLGTLTLRASIRLGGEQFRRMAQRSKRKRTLVYGADGAAVAILRAVRVATADYEVVAFLDPELRGGKTLIGGVPVVGLTDNLAEIAARFDAEDLLVPGGVPGRTVRALYGQCRVAAVQAHVIPDIDEIVAGRVKLSIRDVTISDLLRREPTELDLASISGYITGKVVLVSGGAGSIGSELCRQILGFGPAKLVLVDHSEFGMFQIEQEFSLREAGTCEIVYAIADVNDQGALSRVFGEHQPELVFHAAAYKHVPLMEQNPQIAIRNNVLGTKSIVDLADRFGVERFVLISTDKAVRPTSVMGSTKLVAEKYLQAVAAASRTKFITVRFGNVLNSAGSVVPTFVRQIKAGGPLTVTHPEMTRFFMTIPEAVQLVLQASAVGDSGQVLILDMGEQVRIVDLARDLISLSGLRYPDDIDITFTGLRPGEKLYEELFYGNEKQARKVHEKIFCAQREPIPLHNIKLNISRLEKASHGSPAEARDALADVVAQYADERGLERTSRLIAA